MNGKNTEELLKDQLALCVAALEDCFAEAKLPREDDEYGHRRDGELVNAVRLLKASARLTEALAQLRGETSHAIHVTREGPAKG